MKTVKSKHALLAIFLMALWPSSASADICDPGYKLGSENDCLGCSWRCLPDNNPQPISRPAPQASSGAAGMLQQVLSQIELTDGISDPAVDPDGMGTKSRDHNRRGDAARQQLKFLRASLSFSAAATSAGLAGNAREQHLNRRNALLMDLARYLSDGIKAEGRGKTVQAQISYRLARAVMADISNLPPAVPAQPKTPVMAGAAPSYPVSNDPARLPAVPKSTISGLGNPSAPVAGGGAVARAPAYRAPANPRPSTAGADPVGQLVVPLIRLAQPAPRTQPVGRVPAPTTPVAAAQPPVRTLVPNQSTISVRSPSPGSGPVAQVPTRAAPIVQPPANGGAPARTAMPAPTTSRGAIPPVIVQAPPAPRLVIVQPVVVQGPGSSPTGSPTPGIDPQPVATVPDPDINYSGMDPVALVNAYGTPDPDYSSRNPYNPDPNAGYDPGSSDPGGSSAPDYSSSPDPAPQPSGGGQVAGVRDPDIVCAGGPCTGGSGGYPTGSAGTPSPVDPGGTPNTGSIVPDPSGDPAGIDLGGVSVSVDPTSKPWTVGNDIRSKVLKLR